MTSHCAKGVKLDWASSPDRSSHLRKCPNCLSDTVQSLVLTAMVAGGSELDLFVCASCGAHAYGKLEEGNYSSAPPGNDAALSFYLQQGANIGGMAERLTSLGRGRGTHYLEVGCGFGLGLDFANRVLGWEGIGLDPSPFAQVGRELLGLPISSRPLEQNDPLSGTFDVVHASEVLEHVINPAAMLRTLHRLLKPDGTLLLTTPAAEMIRPETSLGLLIPLLSPGWHTILQTVESLDQLLRSVGFQAVSVVREGAQLVAVAGRQPNQPRPDRTLYLRWLAEASCAVSPTSDLAIGLQARLFREHSAAGRLIAATEAWKRLDGAILARYGQDILSFAASVTDNSLDRLAAEEPLCLGGVLFFRAMETLQAGGGAQELLAGALAAATRLRAALHRIGSDDGDAEEIAFAATAHLIILAARQGENDVSDRLAALEAAGGGRHADHARRTSFVVLVNQGALHHASQLLTTMPNKWFEIDKNESIDLERASLLYCRATLELQTPAGQYEQAVRWLQSLRSVLLRDAARSYSEAAGVLLQPTTEAAALGLRLMGRDSEASALLAEAGGPVSNAPLPLGGARQ